ncbi:MAG: hypothetical protein WCL22_00110 [bacterium]
MKSIPRSSLAWLAVAALIAVGTLVAQDVDPVTQKTLLLSDALKAREDSNLSAARNGYLKILQIDKSDEGAKEGLASVEAAIASATAQKAQVAAAADAPAPAKSLLESVANNQQALFREVPQAIATANEAADNGNYDAALKVLDGVAAALPNNTAAQSLRDDVTLARQEILTRRESGDKGADHLAHAELDRLAKANSVRIDAAEELVDAAEKFIRNGDFDRASENLDKAKAGLPANIATDSLVQRIEEDRFNLLAARSMAAIDAREMRQADSYIRDYEAKNKKANGINDSTAQRLRAEYDSRKSDPLYQNIDEMSPGLRTKDARVEDLLVKGRARYLYGDYTGAMDAYREVLQYQPNNSEAKAFQVRIRQNISENSGQWNRGVTKGKLLEQLDESWKLPEVYNREVASNSGKTEADPVLDKLSAIMVPEINIRDMAFDRAVQQLITISKSYDKDGKGVNMYVVDPEHKNPSVNMTLSDVSLKQALDIIVKQVNFSYTISQGVIELRPDTGSGDMETEFFPLSSAAETKMTGINVSAAPAAGSTGSTFSGTTATGGDASARTDGIKNFLSRSGVVFTENAQLNYDGTTLIVTQNRKSLEKIRNILRRYSDIKQVHIEAKFIEVTENALNELSANLNLATAAGAVRAQTKLRSMNDAYGTSSSGSQLSINNNGALSTINAFAPSVNSVNYGGTTANFGGSGSGYDAKIGAIGSYDLSIFLKAIEQNSGADVMSAPSLTVLDGKTATISIAQLLRYPQSYGDTQATVSQGTGTGAASGNGVAITAGTPQDFTVKEVGVTLEVTPTVGADDSIALNLKPTVTEFEGFVEYGGTSIAITGTTTVSVPSGFFQPIFSQRQVTTDVTIFDGATVVIGGLTREEVKSVNDKVPVLGDIPFFGTAFRSTSKSTVKKNLTVFVTANLVSPGGAPLRSNLPGLRAGSTFQNPIIASPGGAVYREPIEAAAPSAK